MLPHLPSRSESVLKTLIETYLVEGEPVGSRLLSRRFPEPVSPATIRNVLADLEDEDLLAQPHTSAGRVPTEKAYRYYVDRWVKPSPPDPELGAKLSLTFKGLDQDPATWLRHASRVLAEVMGGICMALPFRLTSSRLMRLEFHPLADRRLVAVWIGQTGDVEHQVMENPWGFTTEALTELGNFATVRFRGLTLSEMRQRLVETLKLQADEAHQLLEGLAGLAAQMTDAAEREAPEVVVAGLGELGRIPEFGDSRRFHELVAAFEEHQRLARLLNAFAAASLREVKLLLGSENPYLQDMPLATAMRTVSFPGDERITFALVGPLRMNYVRFLGGLSWWSEEIGRRVPRSV